MRLRRASEPSAADVARRLRTTAALERGELPPDLVARQRRGWRTVAFVAASTVCYVVAGADSVDRFGLRWAEGGQNPEAYGYTRGLYAARSRAVGRVEAQGRAAGADGIVGVTYEQHIATVRREGYGVRDLEVTLHVVGTGVAAAAASAGTTGIAVAL